MYPSGWIVVTLVILWLLSKHCCVQVQPHPDCRLSVIYQKVLVLQHKQMYSCLNCWNVCTEGGQARIQYGLIWNSNLKQEDLWPVSSDTRVLPRQVFINTSSLLQVSGIPVISHWLWIFLHQVLQDRNAATQKEEQMNVLTWCLWNCFTSLLLICTENIINQPGIINTYLLQWWR